MGKYASLLDKFKFVNTVLYLIYILLTPMPLFGKAAFSSIDLGLLVVGDACVPGCRASCCSGKSMQRLIE